MTAPKLEDARIQLNGQELRLAANDKLPELRGTRIPPGRVALEPATITFLTVPDAENGNCR